MDDRTTTVCRRVFGPALAALAVLAVGITPTGAQGQEASHPDLSCGAGDLPPGFVMKAEYHLWNGRRTRHSTLLLHEDGRTWVTIRTRRKPGEIAFSKLGKPTCKLGPNDVSEIRHIIEPLFTMEFTSTFCPSRFGANWSLELRGRSQCRRVSVTRCTTPNLNPRKNLLDTYFASCPGVLLQARDG